MAGAIQPYRPTTADDRIRTVDTLVDVVAPLFEDTYDRAANYPEFIRSDEARSPIFDAARSVARLNCRLWAASDKSNYSVTVNAKNSELCGPYLEELGENPDPGDIDTPFQGGQCVGAGYYVTYEYNSVGTGGQTLEPPVRVNGAGGVAGFTGPISGIRTEGSGAQTILVLDTGDGEALLATTTAPQGDFRNPRIVSVQRAGGLPDDCGNPNPNIRPPATVTPVTPIPPSITINLPGVGPIEIEVELDPVGQPIIIAPELEVEVPISVDVDGDGDGDGGGGEGPPPGDVGDPGSPQNTGDGGDAEGEAPPGSVLVGLRIQILESPVGAREYTPGVFRGVCYIYMGVPGLLDQDYAGSMLKADQFVFAEKDNLTSWRVDANVGYSLRVTPYYREVE